MTKRIRVKSVELVAHCHATEDPDRVKQALLNILPPQLRKSVRISEEHLQGYYHNPITRLRIVIEGDAALEVLRYVLCNLSDSDRKYLMLSLEQRYDRKSNRLFLRLDKQEAYLGTIVLSDGSDTVRISVSFSISRSLKDVEALLRTLCGDEDGSASGSPSTSS